MPTKSLHRVAPPPTRYGPPQSGQARPLLVPAQPVLRQPPPTRYGPPQSGQARPLLVPAQPVLRQPPPTRYGAPAPRRAAPRSTLQPARQQLLPAPATRPAAGSALVAIRPPVPSFTAAYPVPRGATAARTIQRMKSELSVNRPDPAHQHASVIENFVNAQVQAVQDAFVFVISDPQLGPFANLDGHTKHWVKMWSCFKTTGDANLVGAALGYAIESIATLSPKRPTPPSGFSVLLQLAHGPTRPDVVLIDDTMKKEIAWIDLTASESKLHIFDKTGWEDKLNVFEIVYPSIDLAQLNEIAKSLVNTGEIDADTLFREMMWQKYYLGETRKWLRESETTTKRTRRTMRAFVVDTDELKLPRAIDKDLQDLSRRQWVREKLRKSPPKGYGPTIVDPLDDRGIAHLLYFLGMDPKTYGFNDNLSKSSGEQLARTIKGVPTMSAPPETVPRPFPPGGSDSPFGGFGTQAPTSASAAIERGGRGALALPHINFKPMLRQGGKLSANLRGKGVVMSMRNFARLLGDNGVPVDRVSWLKVILERRDGSQFELRSNLRAHQFFIRRRLQPQNDRPLLTGRMAAETALVLIPPSHGELQPFRMSLDEEFELLSVEMDIDSDPDKSAKQPANDF